MRESKKYLGNKREEKKRGKVKVKSGVCVMLVESGLYYMFSPLLRIVFDIKKNNLLFRVLSKAFSFWFDDFGCLWFFLCCFLCCGRFSCLSDLVVVSAFGCMLVLRNFEWFWETISKIITFCLGFCRRRFRFDLMVLVVFYFFFVVFSAAGASVLCCWRFWLQVFLWNFECFRETVFKEVLSGQWFYVCYSNGKCVAL